MMRRVLALVLLLGAVASACSSSDDTTSGFQARIDEADIVVEAGEQSVDVAEIEAELNTRPEVVIVDEPAVRVPDNGEPVEATNWLARTAMTAASVDLVWSPVEGAGSYRLYRVPTAVADYDAIATGDLGEAEEIYEGADGVYGFVDLTAPSGVFLTYLVVAEFDDGSSTEPRWAEALTVDDFTPPTPILGLTGTVTSEGILLEWEPSTDDVEFAAYNVQSLSTDGTAQYLGGGTEPGQVSFLDTNPLAGENRYVVTAVDFHNNLSESAEVTISN